MKPTWVSTSCKTYVKVPTSPVLHVRPAWKSRHLLRTLSTLRTPCTLRSVCSRFHAYPCTLCSLVPCVLLYPVYPVFPCTLCSLVPCVLLVPCVPCVPLYSVFSCTLVPSVPLYPVVSCTLCSLVPCVPLYPVYPVFPCTFCSLVPCVLLYPVFPCTAPVFPCTLRSLTSWAMLVLKINVSRFHRTCCAGATPHAMRSNETQNLLTDCSYGSLLASCRDRGKIFLHLRWGRPLLSTSGSLW